MLYSFAAELNSPDKLSQANAAARIGPQPGPVYMRAELTSGGSAA
ncbi:PPE17 domain protein [Mycobacterium kansasii]|uniref:PPE17 domain protein n=1 Tax=Mycobacterium kansasii TaxID=1768 RepID=A0A1V3XRL5_MYCKA|nr:PPE17 domain protein [Mycobacterium kansasii]